MNNTIVGMGEVLWDMLPEGKQLGGAPANFAYHASQFGFDSRRGRYRYNWMRTEFRVTR